MLTQAKKMMFGSCVITILIFSSAAYSQKLLIPVPLAAPPLEAQYVPPAVFIEPDRWTKEDITHEEQFNTAKKETMSAYADAKNACKELSPTEQDSCLRDAKTEMDKEMLNIQNRFGISR